jgi:hypothetical protein
MVDVVLLQSASYVAAAIGVCIAAFYYVMTLRVQQANMREATNSRRATFVNNMLQQSGSVEWQQLGFEVFEMKWSDINDFMKKYDSTANPKLAAKRLAYLARYEAIGRQVKAGLISLDDIGAFSGYNLVTTWQKFRPIIENYRETEMPRNVYSEFEYAANAMQKKLTEDDPDFPRKMAHPTNQ